MDRSIELLNRLGAIAVGLREADALRAERLELFREGRELGFSSDQLARAADCEAVTVRQALRRQRNAG
jgi:hypothetical protein